MVWRTNSLSDIYFANIFSQSVAYLLILLTVPFTEHRFLILIKLTEISFIDCAFDVISKNSSPSLRSCCFSPTFSSGSFMVLHFTFKSMTHFELIFVKDVKSGSRYFFFSFLHMGVQLFQHHLLKRLFFLHWIVFVLLSKISRLYLSQNNFNLFMKPIVVNNILMTQI